MRVAIVNQKGGVGKSTATVLLACALGAAGKRVAVIDRDPQRTATRWLTRAPAENVHVATLKTPSSPVSPSPDGAEIELVDTPPSLTHAGVLQGIREADRVIVACSTSPADVWSTQEALEMIREKRPDLRPALLFSRHLPHTGFGKTRDDYAKKLGVRALNTAIPERQAIQRAVVLGYRALSSAERETIASVAIEILTLKP